MDEEREAPLDALEAAGDAAEDEDDANLGDAIWTDKGCSAVSA